MRTKIICACIVLLCKCLGLFANGDDAFYKLSAVDIYGKEVSFDKFRGQVVLIVNVATYCWYTKGHYTELVKLQDILGNNKKIVVLGFPCNQFGEQEPDTNNEIEEFVRSVYKINFPLFNKIEVKGENVHPVFQYLKAQSGKEPTWNFWKYLIDHNGKFVNAWGPGVSVESIFNEIKSAVDKAENTSHSTPSKEL